MLACLMPDALVRYLHRTRETYATQEEALETIRRINRENGHLDESSYPDEDQD
jgi:hypothetical protein